MLARPGQYLKKHSRIYVYLNPDPETGPYSWRLSDSPTELPPAPDITSIFTVLPIDSKFDTPSNTMNLFFNIDGLSDVGVARGAGIGTGAFAANRLLNSRYEGKRTTFGIQHITGIAPVHTTQIGGDVSIYFSIQDLPELGVEKRFFSARLSPYNSRSIDKLSADKPLFTSGSDDIVVTFDISSLENA